MRAITCDLHVISLSHQLLVFGYATGVAPFLLCYQRTEPRFKRANNRGRKKQPNECRMNHMLGHYPIEVKAVIAKMGTENPTLYKRRTSIITLSQPTQPLLAQHCGGSYR
jgi:hypothetical protein